MAAAQHLSAVNGQQHEPGYTKPLYCDVQDLLSRGPVQPPVPEYGLRIDQVGIFYRGMVNSLIGDPESGKTWLALAAVADLLIAGGSVLIIDLDHNGPQATISRLRAFGVPVEVLSDPNRFRYTAADDPEAIVGVVRDAGIWVPDFVVIDSVGELLPLYGANSNSADDFTRVHSIAIKPFATAGSCVVLIDHQAKGSDSRSFGATGTAAKKRAISGTLIRVTIDQPFTPGSGGIAELTLVKDRHGGLRAHCPKDREPLVGRFKMTDMEGALLWSISAPEAGERPVMSSKVDGATPEQLLKQLSELVPAPTSIRDVKLRCGWGSTKASEAWRLWQEREGVPA
ncbi:AAA family ATPase [Leucobacter salsicius]|uniref:AAA family ATPase n=1 Tax=Leucobacter salsicius TaxID=664638 RepID=UPI000349D6AC|nr:AAA family ATPase [Leucobacter salsicius]